MSGVIGGSRGDKSLEFPSLGGCLDGSLKRLDILCDAEVVAESLSYIF